MAHCMDWGQIKSSLLPSLIVKTCQGKKNLQWKTHVFEFKVDWILSYSHAKLVSKAKMLKDTMVSKPNGALGVDLNQLLTLYPQINPFPNH